MGRRAWSHALMWCAKGARGGEKKYWKAPPKFPLLVLNAKKQHIKKPRLNNTLNNYVIVVNHTFKFLSFI
jgi:hypothetical protein